MKKVRRFIIGLLAFAVFIAAGLRLVGLKPYNIKTDSMEPTLSVNDMVYVESVDFAYLQEGDIVTYVAGDNHTVTHRIKSVNRQDRTIITQGDNNEYPDIEPVYAENIVGVVRFSIPEIGRLNDLSEKIKNLKGDA